MKKVFSLLLLGFIISSCGDEQLRDDSWDRGQVQACYNDGGTPLFKEHISEYYETVIISFIACDRN
jgi:hypothetical protein